MRGLCYDGSMENKSTPKDFFVHVLTFGLLYVFAISFIALWWEYINIKFPDLLNQYHSYGYDQLRWLMAVLIVVFPVFVLLARMTTKAIAADPSKKDSRIYRWFIYLTLFLSSVTAIVDLITLLYNFLGGEITARFALKVLVVLIVAMGIFGYYLWHLRSDVSQTAKKRHALLWSSVVIVIGSIVFGFFIVGSPATARAQRFDQQRVNDLQQIEYQVINYWQINKKLPMSISDFTNVMSSNNGIDPRTQKPYEYHKLGELQYDLCADFETSSPASIKDNKVQMGRPSYAGDQVYSENWDHAIGRVCFTRTINPDIYPKL